MTEMRIQVQPDGSAVVVRTPLGRSARFRSEHDAMRWLARQNVVVLPVVVIVGGLGTVAKVVLDDDLFVPALVVLFIGAIGAGFAVWARVRGDLPEPTWLTWEESVRVDGREHPLSAVWRDLGVALASGGLLAGAAFLMSENSYRLYRFGAFEWTFVGIVTVGLVVGVVLGMWSAAQRVRYHLARQG